MRMALLLLLAAGPAWAGEIAADALPARVAADAPQVLVLGEIHDNPAHHRTQAAAVAALRPRALVFEMFGPEDAARVTPAIMTDPAALALALAWEVSGWPDFADYAPIFAAAPGARVYGAALPRDQVRRAMREPAAQVFGPEAGLYGLDRAYPAQLQARLEAEVQESHCGALPPALLPGMVAAQRLRDAAFADTVLRALDETGGPVALITGSGHARVDLGVPALLRAARPGVRLLSLGQTEPPAAADQPYDLWVVAPAPPRADPCAAFQ